MKFKPLIAKIILPALVLTAGAVFGQQASLPSSTLQERLLEQLARGNEEQRFAAVGQLVGLFNTAPKTATEQGLALLTNTLQRDSSPQIRALAARAFENCCGEQAVPLLPASLAGEREVLVRKAIVYALAHHRSPQIMLSLVTLLSDKAQEIRGVAAWALAEIADPSSTSELLPALRNVLQKRQKDEDAFTRAQALRALGRIGNHSAIDVLVKSLRRDKSPDARREAAYALGLIADQADVNAVEALREARLESDPYLARLAVEALDKVNSRSS